MVFVILGTEKFPFDGLIQEIDSLKKDNLIKDDIFIQSGSCTYKPSYCLSKPFLSFAEMCDLISNSDMIIAHAGAGTTLLCIQLGHKPILVPRRKSRGEHVDDHQVSFAKKMETTGLIHVVYDLQNLSNAILSRHSTKSSNHRKNSKKYKLLTHFESIYNKWE